MSITLTYSDEMLTSTSMARLKKLEDQISRPQTMIEDGLKLGKDEETGGERITVPTKFNRHSTTTQLSTGFEGINLFGSPTMTSGHDQWAYLVRPIIVSKREETVNRGTHKIFGIVEERVEDSKIGLMEEVETQLARGGVVTASDVNTFNGFDSTGGFLEAATVGSQSNVIHNISKATHSGARRFQNQRFDCAGSFSANGLRGLYDMTTRMRNLKDGRSLESTIRGYGSIAGMNNIKRALESRERYVSTKEIDGGQPVLTYAGIGLKVFDQLPNTGATTTGDPWSFLFLDWNLVRLIVQAGMAFSMVPWQTKIDQRLRVAFIEFFGQSIIKSYGGNGVLFDGDIW